MHVLSVISHVFVLVRMWFDIAVIWICPVETEYWYVMMRPVLDLQCAPGLCQDRSNGIWTYSRYLAQRLTYEHMNKYTSFSQNYIQKCNISHQLLRKSGITKPKIVVLVCRTTSFGPRSFAACAPKTVELSATVNSWSNTDIDTFL